ncbi:hypothetical protein Glove_621g52 [Diversispora epigaea]|uniref:Uncharacterized protein n=1 Tax=Diversispora epigaea TaxID=1348612 RepID=A0A397G5Y5_9GLOM|nr:hypothetical protein Glove_621g52 [Diversispora epigaea]
MTTEQKAPTNAGHNVLSSLRKRLHSLDYTDEEFTRSSNNNNNNNSAEQQPQLTQHESEYIRIPKKPRTSTYSSITSAKGTMNKAMTSKATNYKTSNFTATNSKGTSSKLISRTTIITNNNNNNNKGSNGNNKKQILQRPRQCQHPKHSIYELSSVAVANINKNNKIKKLTDNKNNNKKKKQKKSKGDALGNRLYSVYKRFEGLFNIGNNAVMCRRCLHRTDKDPEYTLNPKYVSAKSIYKVNERKKLIIEMKGVDLE